MAAIIKYERQILSLFITIQTKIMIFVSIHTCVMSKYTSKLISVLIQQIVRIFGN
jgi:hypothetical protein